MTSKPTSPWMIGYRDVFTRACAVCPNGAGVLVHLLTFGCKGAGMFPSVQTLAELSNKSERSVKRALAAFVKAGILTKTNRRSSRGSYVSAQYDIAETSSVDGRPPVAYGRGATGGIHRGPLVVSTAGHRGYPPQATGGPLPLPIEEYQEKSTNDGAAVVIDSAPARFRAQERDEDEDFGLPPLGLDVLRPTALPPAPGERYEQEPCSFSPAPDKTASGNGGFDPRINEVCLLFTKVRSRYFNTPETLYSLKARERATLPLLAAYDASGGDVPLASWLDALFRHYFQLSDPYLEKGAYPLPLVRTRLSALLGSRPAPAAGRRAGIEYGDDGFELDESGHIRRYPRGSGKQHESPC